MAFPGGSKAHISQHADLLYATPETEKEKEKVAVTPRLTSYPP